MESQKDHVSDGGDPEDIPSDFFDDFGKEDFMEGLSVIDSWDDDDNSKRRLNAESIDKVKDLRELIDGGKDNDEKMYSKGSDYRSRKTTDKYKWVNPNNPNLVKEHHQRSDDEGKLDEFIRPGSRRDPSKTNEAIKKDKEVKVKELLAKKLESSNDELRPPGTELDDYYSENRRSEKRKSPIMVEPLPKRPSRSKEQRAYNRDRESPRRRPVRSPRRSPRRSSPARWSPRRNFRHFSPQRKIRRMSPGNRHSPRRYSPARRSPQRRSPQRRSPQRRSPRRSPRRMRRSRSPQYRRHSPRRSGSPLSRDTFLYPNADPQYPGMPYSEGSVSTYPGPSEYSGPGYSYPQGPQYAGGYGAPGYDYSVQQQMPQPVPAPVMTPRPVPAPVVGDPVLNVPPAMVPAPALLPTPTFRAPLLPTPVSKSAPYSSSDTKTPFDALAQLVADGKLSQEDYLKLAPVKKGASTPSMDTKARVMVLGRCNQAISKLSQLLLPNRLVMNQNMIGPEPKYLAPKYCSPLKRQAPVEFQFTKTYGKTSQQNKQLVDSIIATIGLEKVVSRPKKKVTKDMKDAAVQTMKPYCDVCDIRESTKHHEVSTSIEPEHFSASIHTQVVEQDLMSSKSIFNPTGSAGDTAPISIAHMTPAQLVSQLAARAKTLKQAPDPTPPMNQFGRRNPPYDNRSQYHNNYDNYNYRY